jgi:phospholipid/cholesterol/gamma-HCH transport system substrate-binding protein
MQVSNETKVGALTVIAVTLLILGFNFLKGKTILKKSNVLYARFPDVGALEPANQVKIKGYRIGNVYKIDKLDKNVSEVVVTINLLDEINIPANSVAVINSSLTGNSSISKLSNSIDPVMANVKQAVDSLKLLLGNVNSMFDENTKSNLRHTIANLKTTSDNLSVMLNSKNGALAKTLTNVEAFTSNLNTNNEKLNTTIDNFKTTSQKLSELQLQETVANLNNSITQLQGILQKANSKDGSLGLLIHDPKLYNNLQNTTRSLNILLDDFKLHPKRYINVSVFGGKKDKTEPLKAPLADSIYNNQK